MELLTKNITIKNLIKVTDLQYGKIFQYQTKISILYMISDY